MKIQDYGKMRNNDGTKIEYSANIACMLLNPYEERGAMGSQKKTLEQILFEFAGKPTATNAAKNYKVFMEHWDEIQTEHDKGWSYQMIWKALQAEGIITFSYPAFTNYIRKTKSRQSKTTAKSGQPGVGRAEVGQESAPPPTRYDRGSKRF